MKILPANIKHFLSSRFSLQDDKAEEPEIIEAIRKSAEFKGVNLWALIFAILIASIGLNVNSTAVIIGAMLISPIMGPVMGIGLGISINDLQLVKKGAKNLLVATLISILASTIYFFITPLHEAQSELLARTSPSIWDVFIAFFGGCAGMVAASRREKSNVIPGVAIATALMPPLCTAGFALATGNWLFFLGALYLYFINSIFITIATYIMARYLKIHRHYLENEENQKKATRYMIIIVVITIVPSILMAYRIVDKSIFETNARKFVEEQFTYVNTQVVSKSFNFNGDVKSIDLLLIGKELGKATRDSLNKKLDNYKLKGVKLNIRQGLDARHQIDLSQIKASILEDVFNNRPKPDTIQLKTDKEVIADTAVLTELKILYPRIRSFGINHVVIHNAGVKKADTVKLALIRVTPILTKSSIAKLQAWLRARYHAPTLKLVVN